MSNPMAPDKSLAAEIEAVSVETLAEAIRRQVVLLRFNEARTLDDSFDADEIDLLCVRAANAVKDHLAAEIAALQGRAFEDGARWMRERAKLACLDYGEACLDRSIKLLHEHDLPRTGDAIGWADAATGCARLVEALPLQPEGERSDA